MKSYRYIPGDWAVPVDDATYLVLLSIELSFPNRPIPGTAFSGNEVHLDRLIALGWVEAIV